MVRVGVVPVNPDVGEIASDGVEMVTLPVALAVTLSVIVSEPVEPAGGVAAVGGVKTSV